MYILVFTRHLRICFYYSKDGTKGTSAKGVSSKRKGPQFITAFHQGTEEGSSHIHFVFESGESNFRRVWKRIGIWFGLSDGEQLEGNVTLQRVTDWGRFWLYLIRYGNEWVTLYNRSKNEKTRLTQYLHVTTSEIAVEEACMHIHKSREERKGKRIDGGGEKPKNSMLHGAMELIKKYEPTSVLDFERQLSEDDFNVVFTTYGHSYRHYFMPLIRRFHIQRSIDEKNRTYKQHVYKMAASDKRANPRAVQWLFEWFALQGVDIFEFVSNFEAIVDRKIKRQNTFCIQGPSNAGKSTIINLMLDGYSKAFVTRCGDANQFHLQNLLNKSVAIFEEPRITPMNVDDFKLLMGGEPMEVNVKNADHEFMPRIPVFVTTNSSLGTWIPPHDYFPIKNRMFEYKLSAVMGSTIPKPAFVIEGCDLRNLLVQLWTLMQRISSAPSELSQQLELSAENGVLQAMETE